MSTESFDPPSLETLAALLPAYEFQGFIAQGGMGAVYRARQRSLDRDVAIKILPREFGEDLEFRESFECEAKAMARLNHPNLIGVYDFGDADGMPYIVMELVNGKSLFNSANNRAIDPVQAVTIVKGICDGLAHAHENGIIHRDIKPANVLLTPKAEPKIGDFGLARPAGADHSGIIMGTPGYAAPEITHQPDHADRRSDIFALGIVLYELLIGRCPPYEVPRPLASTLVGSDPALDRIIEKATHPVAGARYPSAEAMSAALEDWLRPPAVAPVPQDRAAGQRPPVRDPAPVIVSGGGSEFTSFAKSLVMLALAILISAVAWKKLRSLQDEKAAKQRAYEEAQAQLAKEEKANPPKREVQSPFVPGDKVEGTTTGKRPSETPLESLARLKLALAAGDRDELPQGSIPLDGSDVMVIPTPMTWHDAEAFAESHGGHLFVVESFRDLEQLAGMIPEADRALWLGAGRNPAGTWVNVDGSAWKVTGEPGGEGAYAVVERQQGFQADAPNAPHPFIVQWERDGTNPGTLAGTLRRTSESIEAGEPVFPPGTVAFEGKPVCIVPRATDFVAALAFARQAGGHLAVADTAEKNAWLAAQLASYDGGSGYWIDAIREDGEWKWTTGAAWDFTNWEAEPTEGNGGGVAVMLLDGTWRHLSPGEKTAGFVIEWDEGMSGPGSAAAADVPLPPEIVELGTKAKGLLDGLDRERTKELAANAKTFQWDLDGWLKDLSKNENASWRRDVALLKGLAKGDRVPAKVDQDSGIRLSPRMAKIAEFCAKKQETIDMAFEIKATKIRDAYVARLVESAKAADGPLKEALERHAEAASDLDAWIHGLGLAGKPAAAATGPAFKILSASYGTRGKFADVTAKVKELLITNREDFHANPGSLGVDPDPGWNKGLTIKYELSGVSFQVSKGENAKVSLEDLVPSVDVPANADPIVGVWAWDGGGEKAPMAFRADGSVSNAWDSGTWTLTGKGPERRYELAWKSGASDTITMGKGLDSLSGENSAGKAVAAVRLAR